MNEYICDMCMIVNVNENTLLRFMRRQMRDRGWQIVEEANVIDPDDSPDEPRPRVWWRKCSSSKTYVKKRKHTA